MFSRVAGNNNNNSNNKCALSLPLFLSASYGANCYSKDFPLRSPHGEEEERDLRGGGGGGGGKGRNYFPLPSRSYTDTVYVLCRTHTLAPYWRRDGESGREEKEEVQMPPPPPQWERERVFRSVLDLEERVPVY